MKKGAKSWIMVDAGNSAFAIVILTTIFPIYLHSILPKNGVTFSVFGNEWTSTALSIWGYTVSFSIMLTFLMAPILGAWADEGGHRKRLLGIFTTIGSIAVCILPFCPDWKWSLITVVFGNIGFAGSTVFYNALLPTVAEEKDYDKISIYGYAFGYPGGATLLLLNLLVIKNYQWFGLSSDIAALKLSFFSVGIWWMGFTIPALINIPEEKISKAYHASHTFSKNFMRRLKTLGRTLASLPKIPMLLLFMVAYAFFNEGIQTVIAMASIFGKETVGLDTDVLIKTIIISNFLGLPFTLLTVKLAKKFGSKRTLIGALIFWVVIILFAFRMQTANHFLMLGVLVAMVQGVSQALPRSIFASLIPDGRHAEYFSFFALSGKMTSILGPALFGLVSDITGNGRFSILSLAVFFLIGIMLLVQVRMPRAAKNAGADARQCG
jgi:UMF1 family MFS transporter